MKRPRRIWPICKKSTSSNKAKSETESGLQRISEDRFGQTDKRERASSSACPLLIFIKRHDEQICMPRVFYTPAMGKATMLRRYATVGEGDRWGWLPWCSNGLNRTRSPTRCFCSAADGGTASRSSAGTGMDASCCISYKRLEQAHTNGRKTKRRYGG